MEQRTTRPPCFEPGRPWAPRSGAPRCSPARPAAPGPRSSNFELFQFPIPVILFIFSNSRSLPNFQIPLEFENLKKMVAVSNLYFPNSRKISDPEVQKRKMKKENKYDAKGQS